ncbi:hypothetical protein RUM43_005340 [Polyplax serrata]|uniref:DNA polymerase delta subunit 3 n=1 Tax=Polyplax serrata TaxID=468196 RepID=A0AAN8PDF3_POLSC
MDKKLMNSYLETLEGFVIDEDKIVTYKYLSKSIGVHVNTAKQLLHKYFTQQRNTSIFPICATYLLAGRLQDGSLRVTIVNAADKESEASKFTEITSEHIYSVQKGKSLKDIKVLCGIGKEVNQIKKSHVIQCSKCTVKDNNSSRLEIADKAKKAVIQEKQVKCEPLVAKESHKSPPKSQTENVEISKSPKLQRNKNSPKENNLKVNKKHDNKPKGNIANFFSNKATQNIAENSTKVQTETKEQQIVALDNKIKYEIEEETKVDLKPNRRNLKEKKRHNNEGVKRKRIQLFSDSDDTSNSDDEPPSQEEQELEAAESVKMQKVDDEQIDENNRPRNKRKKRKIVDVTVMSEDGYLGAKFFNMSVGILKAIAYKFMNDLILFVFFPLSIIETRKEVTLATDSEEETEHTLVDATCLNKIPEKSTVKIETTVKEASGGPKKQSSLLNFFKKNKTL